MSIVPSLEQEKLKNELQDKLHNELHNELLKELMSLKDEKYRKFTSSLVPGCENILGVRIPKLRKIAKRIAKEKPLEYLATAHDDYFEEIMLQGLVINELQDELEVILEETRKFVPKISNWSVCDSFCIGLKIVKVNKKRFWEFIKQYLNSTRNYDIRFGLVLILYFYNEKEYLERNFKVFDTVLAKDYYVKTALAWAIATCFTKFPKKTMEYLNDNQLDKETYNKALQKIRESLKVDKKTKEIIKKMKRV